MNFAGRKKEDTDSRAMKFPTIDKIMAKDEMTFSPDQPINEVIDILLKEKATGAPVLDRNRKIVGMITEKDCMKVLIDSAYHNMPSSDKTVSHYMSPVVKTVTTDHDLLDVANEFLTTNYRKFPVVYMDTLVGQISRRDVLRAISEMSNTTW
jgi:predicted transcriptional regulator